MKKITVFICVLVLLVGALCSCSPKVCENCGESTYMTYHVGDDVDGITLCEACTELYQYSRLHLNFTCSICEQEKIGKKNVITVDGKKQSVCNTCLGKMQ